MEMLRGIAVLCFIFAGLLLIAPFFVAVPWQWSIGAAINLCLPAAVLLALDMIIRLLIDIRDALRETDLDAEKSEHEEFLRGEDERQPLGEPMPSYLSKGRVAPDDIPAQFRDD